MGVISEEKIEMEENVEVKTETGSDEVVKEETTNEA